MSRIKQCEECGRYFICDEIHTKCRYWDTCFCDECENTEEECHTHFIDNKHYSQWRQEI